MKTCLINGAIIIMALLLPACEGTTAVSDGGIIQTSPGDSPPYVITKPVFESAVPAPLITPRLFSNS